MHRNEIGLALQGGGAYAAFTAGVLDALLNRRRNFLPPEDIRSISGTSGGALNAALLGLALHEGQHELTRYVNRLWEFNRLERVIRDYCLPLHLVPDEYIAALFGTHRHVRDALPQMADAISENIRLHGTLTQLINTIVHAAAPSLAQDLAAPLLPNRRPYVAVAATEIRTAEAHYFTNNTRMIARFRRLKISRQYQILNELTLNGVYASMAHPSAFAPVVIGENIYWDGYYTANPPFTFLYREGCEEVILVRLVQTRRDAVGQDGGFIRDRTEEIIQTTTLSKEIQAYLAMRDVWFGNRDKIKGMRMSMAMRKFDDIGIFHEIRLLKSGKIWEQGYPFSDFVDKLLRLGREVVAHRKGFIATYRQAPRGMQIISEIDFDDERVESSVIDLDALLFEAQQNDD